MSIFGKKFQTLDAKISWALNNNKIQWAWSNGSMLVYIDGTRFLAHWVGRDEYLSIYPEGLFSKPIGLNKEDICSDVKNRLFEKLREFKKCHEKSEKVAKEAQTVADSRTKSFLIKKFFRS
ncbi:MAG: hypothetical protein FWC51_01060 [Proteobacteria bacterium]|nr:hypothetical protein [Pseudomonadota bacterium]